MEKKELREVLKFYKSVYVGSMINVEDKTLFSTWYELLKDYTVEQVKSGIIKRSRQSSYPANIPEIIANIDIPDYEIVKIVPSTIIIHFEDETFGNFPFRFETSEEAKKYAKLFKDCNYDKEMIKELHQEFISAKNVHRAPLTIHGMELSQYNEVIRESKRKGRYDK